MVAVTTHPEMRETVTPVGFGNKCYHSYVSDRGWIYVDDFGGIDTSEIVRIQYNTILNVLMYFGLPTCRAVDDVHHN